MMAPSSPVEEDKLDRGVQYLEKLGYRVKVTPSCYAREHYLAGSAAMRATEMNELVKDPSVDAIFFARGGFGSSAMLPLLDFREIRSQRKLMVGYSDITALQWGIYARCGLPSLSAGMPATDFCNKPVNPKFEEPFWKFIETGRIDYQLTPDVTVDHAMVNGVALPGTLSVAAKLAGTSWLPSLKNTILILEDVGESRHKIEGYLWQAKLGGWFDSSSAVLFGDFSSPEKETFPDNPDLETILKRIFDGSKVPYIMGIPYGHIDHKIPFPVGQEISLSLGLSVTISSTDTLFDF